MCDNADNNKRDFWFSIMTDLIYPAFLGASFVWFFDGIIKGYCINCKGVIWDLLIVQPDFMFALWFIIYFVINFYKIKKNKVENKEWAKKAFFVINFLDIILIYLSFYFLGFIGERFNDKPCIIAVYSIILIISSFSLATNKKETYSFKKTASALLPYLGWKSLHNLRIAAISCSILFSGLYLFPSLRLTSVLVSIIFFYFMLINYALYFYRQSKEE